MANLENEFQLKTEADTEVPGQKSEEENETPFSAKTWKEDLTLVVEGKEMHVSKVILARVSPVFDRMFSSEFKEKTSDRLILPDKDYDTFLEFLCCIYPGVDKQITDDNVEDILPLLDEYQVDSLKKRCEALLLGPIDADTDIDDVYNSLSMAAKYDMGALKERCIEIASERDIDDMMRAKDEYEIPSDVHEQVLALSVKRLQLDVKESSFHPDSAALNSAKTRSVDKENFMFDTLTDCIPSSYSCGATSYSITSYYPQKETPMNYDARKNLVKSLRVSRKLEDAQKSKILLKICRDRSVEEMEEIDAEDEVQCLPSDIKDCILKKTSSPPDNILWT